MSRLCRLKTASHGDDGKWAYEEIVSQRQRIEALTAQVGVLREALERSGHNIGCARNHFSSVCTCGLNEALASTPESALSEVRKAEREKCALAITHAWHKEPCYLRDLTDAIRAMGDE